MNDCAASTSPLFFDTHFHLYPEDDLDGIIARARQAGVQHMLVAGAPLGQTKALIQRLSGYRDTLAVAVGVHPHEAEKFNGDLTPFRVLLESGTAAGVGEIGLDYHYQFASPEAQQKVFRDFLQLAAETGLPPLIHCREAFDDTLQLISETLPDGQAFVIHCFTGNAEWARRFLDRGGLLSYSGILTFPRSESIRAALRITPADRLLFETDAPYLAPVPFRGKRNEPAFLPHTVAVAAREVNVPVEKLAARSTRNAEQLFGIRCPHP